MTKPFHVLSTMTMLSLQCRVRDSIIYPCDCEQCTPFVMETFRSPTQSTNIVNRKSYFRTKLEFEGTRGWRQNEKTLDDFCQERHTSWNSQGTFISNNRDTIPGIQSHPRTLKFKLYVGLQQIIKQTDISGFKRPPQSLSGAGHQQYK